MKKLQNPCLVRLHEVINSEDSDKLVLVIDFCDYGEIMNWDEDERKFAPCIKGQKQFTESEIQRIMRDLIVGLDYLHKNRICHRDIKPQNILLDGDGTAKIADFGSAEFFASEDSDLFKNNAGTYQFFGPELCDPNTPEYSGKAADIWALGVTLYAITFNELPFDADTEIDLFEVIKDQKLDFISESNRNISEGLTNLITTMLEKDPKKRASMADLKTNSWLNEGFKVSLAAEGV